jgi:hypothetical protein
MVTATRRYRVNDLKKVSTSFTQNGRKLNSTFFVLAAWNGR